MIADWAQEDTEAAAGGSGTTQHLWEESWDDDDTSDDFSAQLKYGVTSPALVSVSQLTVIQGGVEEGRGQQATLMPFTGERVRRGRNRN